MEVKPHPHMVVSRRSVGRESQPLLVIDNAVADPDQLVEEAAHKIFGEVATYYPGLRAKAPLAYQQFVLSQFHEFFRDFFGLTGARLRFTSCHYSLVTKRPEELSHPQRIPHVDSVFGTEIAMIHYLFRGKLGGTAFYRHRKTGFEFIDLARRPQYFAEVEVESMGPDKPPAAYIDGDTALYEQTAYEEGIFNRMLIYRRNVLHSGSVGKGFVADANPRTGRLSINGFMA